MNKKLPIFGIFLLIMALFVNAEMIVPENDSFTGNPGSTLSETFTIENTYQFNLTNISFSEDSLFGGTNIEVTTNLDTIVEGLVEVVNFKVTIPDNQDPGSNYKGIITINSNDDMGNPVLPQEYMFNVTVNEVRSISINPTSDKITVNQGESASIDVEIKNEGNVDYTNVKLELANADSFKDEAQHEIGVDFSQNDFTLNKGASRTITVTANTEQYQYLGELTGDITITATTASNKEDVKTFRLTVDTTSNNVKIDLDDQNLENLAPGDDFNFDINLWNVASYDLEKVEVKVWIRDIDDGKDFYDRSSRFSLDSNEEDDVEFKFTVPLNVDEDDYNIKVKVKGKDKDDPNNDFEVIKIFKRAVEVTKEEGYEVEFNDITLSSSSLTCDSIFTTSFDLINIGNNDLNDMYIKLIVKDLGLEQKSETFDLEEDKYDDRERSLQFTVSLPSKLTKNNYLMKFYAYDDEDDEFDVETYTLTLIPCAEEPEQKQETDDTTTSEENKGVFLPTGYTTLGLDKDTWTTVFWILGDAVLVLVAIYFIVLIFRRRR